MRPSLLRHRKFARLARLIGSEALAVGHLELLWHAGYEAGDPRVGDAGDVEYLARWTGTTGVLCSALLESGFVDEVAPGVFEIHDLYDHSPEYVRKRMDREKVREMRGVTLSEDRRDAALTRWRKNKMMQTDASDCHLHPREDANGTPPAPAPAPKKKKHPSKDASKKTPPPGATVPASEGVVIDVVPERDPVEVVVEHWNEVMLDNPACTKTTPGRRAAILARVEEHGLDAVVAAIGRCHQSFFLTGRTEAAFRPGIDWVMKPSNFVKIIEGNYDGRRSSGGNGRAKTDDLGLKAGAQTRKGWTWGYSEQDWKANCLGQSNDAVDLWEEYLDAHHQTLGWEGEHGKWPSFDTWLKTREVNQ